MMTKDPLITQILMMRSGMGDSLEVCKVEGRVLHRKKVEELRGILKDTKAEFEFFKKGAE